MKRKALLLIVALAVLVIGGIALADYPIFPRVVDTAATPNCFSIGASSARYQLPKAGDYYLMQASGNSAYVKSGDVTVTATTATTGHGFVLAESVPYMLRPTGPYVAYIGGTAGGELCFLRLPTP